MHAGVLVALDETADHVARHVHPRHRCREREARDEGVERLGLELRTDIAGEGLDIFEVETVIDFFFFGGHCEYGIR
ncbi:MAG: hypothetical protein CMB57_06665 [Euryarchaeota archaeon]|nr:hypothetical protein [Euryarchaeota archaeon]